MLGGSYVVDPVLANDFDFFVHQYEYYNDDYLSQWDRVGQGHEKYPDIDHDRLIAVFEHRLPCGKKCNAIVVSANYWPAYIGAIATMKRHPERFVDREARIKIHRHFCQQVKATFEGLLCIRYST